MIIPEFDGIVRFIGNIDGTRSVRAGEGLGQHDPGNFHTEHQHVAHKTEFLPYRYVIVFNEDISSSRFNRICKWYRRIIVPQ